MRKSKYGAIKTRVNGLVFDSKGEAARYIELTLMEKAGAIKHLKRQEPFIIEINGKRIGTWKADFTYYEKGELVIEDYKGYKHSGWAFKRKVIEALFMIKIRVTGPAGDKPKKNPHHQW